MKTWYAKPVIKKVYKVIGLCFIGLLIAVIVLKPFSHLSIGTQILMYGLTVMLTVLNVLRPYRCKLTIDDERIFFDDGMMCVTKVPLDLISKVIYNPGLSFRIILKKHKREIKVNNAFSVESQEEILKYLKKKRHNIRIERIERPDKLIYITHNKEKSQAV